VGQPTSAADCANYKLIAAHVKAGVAAFNAPDPMFVGQSTTLQLAVGETGSPVTQMVGKIGGRPTPYGLPIGRFMSAELLGEGFDIDPKGPQSKEVPMDSVTTWEWKITAREEGLRTLILKTTVNAVAPDGRYLPLRSSTKNQSIHIKVSAWDRFWNIIAKLPGWLKAITAVVTAAGALIAAILGLRHRAKKEP
jgi:hypothetical protein